MKKQIVKSAPTTEVSRATRKAKGVVESTLTSPQEIAFTKGDKVQFHPYRQKSVVRGTIISKTPSTYERKKTHEKMSLVTIKTSKGKILTKTTNSLKLLEKVEA